MLRSILRAGTAVVLAAGAAQAQVGPIGATAFLSESGTIRFRAFNRPTETASQTRRVIGPSSGTCNVGALFNTCGAQGAVYGGGIHLGTTGSSNFIIGLSDLAVTETNGTNTQSLAGGTVTPFNSIRLIQTSDVAGTFSMQNLAICQIGGMSCNTLGTFALDANATVIDQLFAGPTTLEAFELRGTFSWQTLDETSGDRPSVEFRFGSTAVPEPGTFALVASGVAGLVGVARRRRRA